MHSPRQENNNSNYQLVHPFLNYDNAYALTQSINTNINFIKLFVDYDEQKTNNNDVQSPARSRLDK